MAWPKAAPRGTSKGDVQALLGQSHLQISADGDRDEFTETEVADKIKKAAGAKAECF